MKSGETVPQNRLHEDIALLAAYLLSSGRGLLNEPADYGAFRCADAARRLLEILDRAGGGTPGFTELRKSLDDIMFAPMGGDRDMAEILDELCLKMADTVKDAAFTSRS
ncbi:hypothetical protein I5Q34_25865 [Streptomyces sp. AV19]|uniref:DUF6092 family protein n=1 Tax=Streptomyces sp. AV19 TaxID=2793068 RepID=UPI0018FE7B01|nr:DUF6092 family protein [Streptomyces sp. AV19]MBH1937656.1 hypothetical protein [Streptomyces sp. AV19]MDG4536325.1 DUF6092 family protein [Streptomyces sp. AV19]